MRKKNTKRESDPAVDVQRVVRTPTTCCVSEEMWNLMGRQNPGMSVQGEELKMTTRRFVVEGGQRMMRFWFRSPNT